MDIVIIKLIEIHIDLPFDVILFINEYVKYEKITDDNIHEAVDLWCDDKKLCTYIYDNISCWNVESITNMRYLFNNHEKFNNDISKWNVSNVCDMYRMFYNAYSFNSDISKWDVSNVKYMSYMFYNAGSFNSDISKWDVSKVKYMNYMFYNATSFNTDISNWNIQHDTIKNNMFNKKTRNKYMNYHLTINNIFKLLYDIILYIVQLFF